MTKDTCKWTPIDWNTWQTGPWKSECGETWYYEGGETQEKCPRCGKIIIVFTVQESDEVEP